MSTTKTTTTECKKRREIDKLVTSLGKLVIHIGLHWFDTTFMHEHCSINKGVERM